MTQQRVTQVIVETIRRADNPQQRLTQLILESVRRADPAATNFRLSHLTVDVLRIGGGGGAARIFPVLQSQRVTHTAASGTRIFPI
jgi:hypothetical protein